MQNKSNPLTSPRVPPDKLLHQLRALSSDRRLPFPSWPIKCVSWRTPGRPEKPDSGAAVHREFRPSRTKTGKNHKRGGTMTWRPFTASGLPRATRREYHAVKRIFNSSGLSFIEQRAILQRSIHTSSPFRQDEKPKDDKDKKNEEGEKLGSLLAKAFLWMLTAYMLVATLSLMFPNSNQNEVRDLFKEGRKRAPCIIYIDEIDAMGRKRPGGGAGGPEMSTGEGEQTLNQLLVEMDGIASTEGVLLLASTNRADVLDQVDKSDLEYAIERVVGGTEKKSHAMTATEKRIVAVHESGHALVGWLTPKADKLLKVTIVPRTNLALGFAQYTPAEQKLYTKEEVSEFEVFEEIQLDFSNLQLFHHFSCWRK
ncbi:unnamed protein product [Nesidiocoris tenuis]|uniref:ATPase AAA-type core domain-containing protein n=1 Tax=Nesidiocoris tenuis TaxID=355587 RepID=A0A6H5GH13_9HEMI|nr:unnamed protein product [Nesidiocoris tenuis]